MEAEIIGKLYYVEWLDSATNHGWAFPEDSDLSLSPIKSVGWIIADCPDSLVLAACISNEEGYKPSNNRRVVIPKAIITKQIEILEHLNK